MDDGRREAWITGIGIVSCLGEGPHAHWQGLNAGQIRIDAKTFAPYLVHSLAPLDLDKQIPKKGDQRQMEPWQRIGTYAAGLALADAGVKGNPELLARTDMIVAAGGGERDVAVDGTILTNRRKAANPGAFLNERHFSDAYERDSPGGFQLGRSHLAPPAVIDRCIRHRRNYLCFERFHRSPTPAEWPGQKARPTRVAAGG